MDAHQILVRFFEFTWTMDHIFLEFTSSLARFSRINGWGQVLQEIPD